MISSKKEGSRLETTEYKGSLSAFRYMMEEIGDSISDDAYSIKLLQREETFARIDVEILTLLVIANNSYIYEL